MAQKNGDITKIVLESVERIASAEQKIDVHHERLGILEKAAANMSLIPQTVAALSQKVESLDTSMKREVDGLREQQKAHQTATAEHMAAGFTEMGEKVDGSVKAIGDSVDGLIKAATIRKGIWQFLQTMGQFALGGALVAEAFKAVFGH